jgi:hypothetical protein
VRHAALIDVDAARSYPALSLAVPVARARRLDETRALADAFANSRNLSIVTVNRKVDGTFTD